MLAERGCFLLVTCNLTNYNRHMIKSFRHKGIQDFFETGTKAGIQPSQASRLRIQLTRLEAAITPQDMNAPGWRLHQLSGNLAGHWAVTVNGNWRLTFVFEGTDAVLVDYQEYH
jgi:proteic killer suppression protein